MAVLAVTSAAQADIYGFQGLTANDIADVATGEAQLFVEVTDLGSSQVMFTFTNTGPNASSITDVYFDDGTLLGIASLVDSDDGTGGDAGVDFSEGASPPTVFALGSLGLTSDPVVCYQRGAPALDHVVFYAARIVQSSNQYVSGHNLWNNMTTTHGDTSNYWTVIAFGDV